MQRESTPKPESQLREEVAKPPEEPATTGAETNRAPGASAMVDSMVAR